ncbi:hypothetical protein SAMN05421890_1532 [Ensifer adhaerens]|nr:hypothetical protein SAMN05421890_1532 [Ensifer adhaerens]
MSAVLSENLDTLSGDMMLGHISPAYASAQLRLLAEMARLLEQEVEAFRVLECNRAFTRSLEAESMRSLHELARMPDPNYRPIKTGADIVTLHPKTGGRDDG